MPRALVKLGPRVDAAWLRLAWHAAEDASGPQLASADSPPLEGDLSTTATVETSPALAPDGARSVRVRILLRPAGAAAAAIAVDSVEFGASAPPLAPQRPPTASLRTDTPARPEPPPAAAAPESATGRTAAPLRERSAAAAEPPVTAASPTATAAGDALLRITELVLEPEPPGNDADFEWVELTNLGARPQPLANYLLRDNRADTPLPAIELPAGASLVVAATRAAVDATLLHRLAGHLGNGLGNGGDRRALVAQNGALVDALSCGTDATYDDPPLLAPGPGEALRRYFADDGSLLAVQLAVEPSPGRIEAPPAPAAARPRATIELEPPDSGQRQVWALLGAGGAATVAAFGWRR